MTEHVIRMPDVGEGVAEAELIEWHVRVGDLVQEDMILAAVMTDKATVDIPSPVMGEIIWLGAKVGDVVAVGSDLVRLNVPGKSKDSAAEDAQAAAHVPVSDAQTTETPLPIRGSTGDPSEPAPAAAAVPNAVTGPPAATAPFEQLAQSAPRPEGEKPLAAPALRLRARAAGIDLRQVPGTGLAGRITHEDLDAFFARDAVMTRAPRLQPKTGVEDVKVIGLRRRIADKMSLSNARIPHITYVEEVDVTGLEELRATLNRTKRQDQPKLTLLPFLMRAMVRAIAEQPGLNALFDDDAGIVHQHAGVHVGIATQTGSGLMVPVVRHVEALDLWSCGAEVNRLAEAAKNGTAARDELSGSTITITSLGAMGGVVTTPIINHPEVTIIGVNKIMMRPVWDGSAFIPRKMMNLSSSFDHRVVDGYDAAVFVQRIKTLLETPALIFMEG